LITLLFLTLFSIIVLIFNIIAVLDFVDHFAQNRRWCLADFVTGETRFILISSPQGSLAPRRQGCIFYASPWNPKGISRWVDDSFRSSRSPGHPVGLARLAVKAGFCRPFLRNSSRRYPTRGLF
jgi:hypothetical protein